MIRPFHSTIFLSTLGILITLVNPLTAQATTTSTVSTNVSVSTNTGGNQTSGSISTGSSSASVHVEQQVNGQTLPPVDINVTGSAEQAININQSIAQPGVETPRATTSMPVVPTNTSSPPSVTSAPILEETPAVGAPPTSENPTLWERFVDGVQSLWDRLVKAIT